MQKNIFLLLVVCLLIVGFPLKSSSAKSSTFYVVVDYSLSLEDAIKVGHYASMYVGDGRAPLTFPCDAYLDRKHYNYLANESIHPERKREKVKIELISFPGIIENHLTPENIISKMEKQGLRPATLRELLAFGATYPNEQRHGYGGIYALGSMRVLYDEGIPYYHFIPEIWSNPDERGFGENCLEGFYGGYVGDVHFAVVRK